MSRSIQFGPHRVSVSGLTDVGRKRNHNEDALYLSDIEPLMVVADGMGGHEAGDRASRIAIDSISGHFTASSHEIPPTWPFMADQDDRSAKSRMVTSIQLANHEIFSTAQRENRHGGMGTTVVALFFTPSRVLLGHVGDSRIYRMRHGGLSQLTEDHSLLNDYIRMNRISAEQAEEFPHHNVIVRALGMKKTVPVDLLEFAFSCGDIYLLCSDGLSGMINDEQIAKILRSHANIDDAAQALIDAANANGGTDNITVVLASVTA